MRKLLVLTLVIGVAGFAAAADLGNLTPAKSDPIVPENPVNPDRQGGDTIFDATVIPGLPYNDSGTTFGYLDDYDEVCPYSGSTSADVCYVYTPAAAAAVDIDLCGSSYDTKLYVYDAGLALVACNDDFYFDDVCGVYVSKLENVNLAAGETYYIIVDGYGGDAGDYLLEIIGFEPCVVDCPAGAFIEGEPELVDGYADSYNGGCNSPEFGNPFQMVPGNDDGTQILCGVAGWYDGTTRDTDWFIVKMGATGVIDLVIDAEYAVYLFELFPQDCAAVAVAQQATGGPCLEAYMTISGYGEGDDVWVWVGPTVYSSPDGTREFDYVLWMTGLFGEIATEDTSWSSLKALYQ